MEPKARCFAGVLRLDAFTSLRQEPGDNAPVSGTDRLCLYRCSATCCVEAQITASASRWRHHDGVPGLRQQLAAGRYAGGFLASLFIPPDDDLEPNNLRVVLDSLGKGRPLVELDPVAPGTACMFSSTGTSVANDATGRSDTLEVFAKRLATCETCISSDTVAR